MTRAGGINEETRTLSGIEAHCGHEREQAAPAPDAEPKAEATDRTGEVLGRFQLTGLLGRGGMGVVYAATDLTLRRKVAVKLLHAEALPSDERRRRFLREARVAAAVSHPNLAAVFELGEVGGEVFIAMELVQGGSLRGVLDAAGGALSEAEAVRIASEIARGLAAAHQAGVIHRDIKPENVMISGDGRAKLLDFGLAKLDGGPGAPDAPTVSAVETRAGSIMGTPCYMSPEQARGLAAGAPSDVFSLGVVLFEMLAGERPFHGATTMDVLTAIIRDEPTPLLGVSPALADVVLRCLSKEPSERHSDAAALLAALETATSKESPAIDQNGPASSPHPRRAASNPAPPSRRRRWALIAVLAAAATMAVGGLWLRARMMELPPKGWQAPDVPAEGPRDPALIATAPKPGPTAITDLPLPTSSSTEAIAAYKAALQSFRDADWSQAEMSLRKAVELDPTLAAAQLRLAIVLASPERLLKSSVPDARAAYREATRFRNALTPRDRALLTALEPALLADSSDVTAAARRLADLAELYPYDAEIFFLLAGYRLLEAPEHRLAAARRAVELDPEYADAWQVVGAALVDTDPDGALAALERCTTIAPTALDCWGERAKIESALGRCVDAEAHFRHGTSDPRFSRKRAEMLYTLGKPREAITEVLQQVWARDNQSAVARGDELFDRALIAVGYGDFDTARARAAEGLVRVGALPDLHAHARFALLLADIELETGRVNEAAAVALDFLKRRDGWQLDTPMADPTVYLTRVAARSGALSAAEVRARRDAWYGAAKASTARQKAVFWSLAYAQGIEREEEASEALAARPPDFPSSSPSFSLDADIGRALWLVGKRDEAIVHLSRAFVRCDRPPFFSRTELLFGQALEDQGNKSRACEAYQIILARWGKAKPRSVTAGEAKRRVKALRCDAAPP